LKLSRRAPICREVLAQLMDPSARNMRILVAEDDPVLRHRLHAALSSWGYDVTSVVDGQEALREVARPDAPNLAILDWSMPKVDGLEVCRAVRTRAAGQYVYMILLTSNNRDDDVLEGFDAGADDYITKPFDTRQLKARVRSGARIVQLQQELITAREQLREKAMHDPLTGLLTRGAFFEICDGEVARAARHGQSLALMMADLDHFKAINDQYGHLAGDDVLRETATRLRSTFRRGDAVGRYGGEEFVALAIGCQMQDALGLAERFRENISREPVATSAGLIQITTSIGVAAIPNVETSWTLLKAADEALYRAKAAGRNTVAYAA
jgi:two-component system, cell cycle response regulator